MVLWNGVQCPLKSVCSRMWARTSIVWQDGGVFVLRVASGLGPNIAIDQSESRVGNFKMHSNMAADSKYSVRPVASLLCENQGFNSQEKGTHERGNDKRFVSKVKSLPILWFSGPGSYTWQREIQTTQDHRTINDILERRGTEVRTLYEQCQESGEIYFITQC